MDMRKYHHNQLNNKEELEKFLKKDKKYLINTVKYGQIYSYYLGKKDSETYVFWNGKGIFHCKYYDVVDFYFQ